jgi:hypothetical protein
MWVMYHDVGAGCWTADAVQLVFSDNGSEQLVIPGANNPIWRLYRPALFNFTVTKGQTVYAGSFVRPALSSFLATEMLA